MIRIATCRVQEDIWVCHGTWIVCNLDDKGKLFGVLQPEETMAAEAVRSASRMCCIRNSHVKLELVINVKQYSTTIQFCT